MDDRYAELPFLTVRELAELLRVKERKVYHLAETGKVPCTRATGKLLFPTREVMAWLEGSSGGSPDSTRIRPTVFLGSHDPLLDRAIRESQCGLATLFDSSLSGLDQYGEGDGLATGMHVFDGRSRTWNVPVVKEKALGQNAVLIGWAMRQRGLVIRREDRDAIRGPHDLEGRRMIHRQPEAGTEALWSHVCREQAVPGHTITRSGVARSEADAVLAVAEGRADAAFGLECVARPYGLSFVPVIEEQFDLLVDRRAWFEEPMQVLVQYCRGDAFRAMAEDLPGYDLEPLGLVRWNG